MYFQGLNLIPASNEGHLVTVRVEQKLMYFQGLNSISSHVQAGNLAGHLVAARVWQKSAMYATQPYSWLAAAFGYLLHAAA